MALLRDALARTPAEAELLFALGSILFDWGRYREARPAFLRALQAGMRRSALYLNLAWTCHLVGRGDEAETHARTAIGCDAGAIAGHLGLGAVLQRRRRYPEAIASFERALALDPASLECIESIAACLLEQKAYTSAETWARRAIQASEARPRAWNTLGIALANQQRIAEALAALRRAYQVEKTLDVPADSIVDYGFAMILAGRFRDAVALYRAELPHAPIPAAHAHYAFSLLALGKFAEGWRQYEFRWLQEPHLSNRTDASRPPWSGQDLAGKVLLIRAEQGFGDIFQFARYAARFKAMGATVVLQARAGIAGLARGFAGVDEVFVPPAAAPTFDYYVHLMSIPDAVGADAGAMSIAVPYLRVSESRQRQWADKIVAEGLKVGLVWAGNPLHSRDRYRSMRPADIAPLLDVAGVHFFALQKDATDVAPDAQGLPPNWTDLGPQLNDFEDTAAAIAHLDLVLCVDTAVAHLAGALGKPVWLMLPAIGDFRWIEGTERSPWYPTMRLFWQRTLGDWQDVVARVAGELRAVVQAGASCLPPAVDARADAFQREEKAEPRADLAEVVETRHGILQYFPDGSDLARSLRHYGEYRHAQVELLARLVAPGATIVEAGSGIGAHTIALARRVGDDGHLIAYEPRTLARRVLGQNLAANRAAQPVTVMRGALAGPPDDAAAANGERETLDDLGLDRLDLVTIDGARVPPEVLDGAAATLWRLRPRIVVQAPDAGTPDAFVQRLLALGYRCWRMDVPLFDPSNFYRRTDDIFAGRRATALVALPEEAGEVALPESCVEITVAAGREPVADREPEATPQEKPAGIVRALTGLLFDRSGKPPKRRG